MSVTATPATSHVGRAILMVLFAYFLFSFVDTSTKWMLGLGQTALQLAFMRYFVHFLITLADTGRQRKTLKPISARYRGIVILRSFCLVSATVANFYVLLHLPLAVTAAILHVAPVLVCLFAWPILGERVKAQHWLAVFLGLAGVLIIVQPFGTGANWYAVLMLYPATCMALYTVLTRKLAGIVSPATSQFYTGALGTVALLPFGIMAWETPPSPLAWGLTIGIGVFAWAGHEVLIRAHAYAGASLLAPFGYAFVVYLAIAGWLVFDHIPEWYVGAGALLIFAAGLIIWRAQRSE